MLRIEKTIVQKSVILQLIGEVDASNSVELDDAIQTLVQEDAKSILVDGTGLEYISSAGLGVFMSYLEEFEEKEIVLVIFGLSDKVQQVFHILGLDQLINIKETKEEALEVVYAK
ncbi:STAS domain-containing protein [Rhodonellum sp.]|uniref:STAS domain-containing protein n=1 Tax=Rhodonellum sp. TaxID=2231180 RepID=UPI0027261A94|nr:STAS domain-containing protein [Rhodonellum sp.]MDO9553622.1 STAS domain-containing protein [Rhodonellum sp.]